MQQAELHPQVRQAPQPPGPGRLDALVQGLSPRRHGQVGPLLGELATGEARDLGDPLWKRLATELGQDIFEDLVVSRHDLQRVARLLLVKDRQSLQLPNHVIGLLSGTPLADLGSLAQVLDGLGCRDAETRAFVQAFLFQVYVIALNARLQLLYRSYLATRPFSATASEDDRVQHLTPMEPLAYRLISASDPARVLDWLGMTPAGEAAGRLVMALNKFHFDPYRVNFRFTHHCNIQCAHCYNFSGPKMKSEKIALEKMVGIVRDMPKTGMSNINLTGGEPFMYLDTVLTLIREARAAGVEAVTIYTNGFFAKTEAGCRKVLARLQEAGFMNALGREEDHIKVSAGVFHQEFLPFETVVNLIRVYREVFGKNVLVDYEVLQNRTETEGEVLRELQEKGVADKVELQFRRISPIGRGLQFDPELKHLPTENFKNCRIIDEIVFDPDGSVLPCCGMNFGNKGIVIGEIDDCSLPALFRRLENNAILQYITNNPIRDLFAYRDRTPAKIGYADLCSLCHHALGDLEESQDLKRALSDQQDFFPVWFEAGQLVSAAA